jgi:hypothetical protein
MSMNKGRKKEKGTSRREGGGAGKGDKHEERKGEVESPRIPCVIF